jgi:transaldolase
MKLFIDSGNLRDIESLVPLGIIDGVTTNPSLLAKESGDPRAIVKNICQTVKGPVSAEVVATASRRRRCFPAKASASTSP